MGTTEPTPVPERGAELLRGSALVDLELYEARALAEEFREHIATLWGRYQTDVYGVKTRLSRFARRNLREFQSSLARAEKLAATGLFYAAAVACEAGEDALAALYLELSLVAEYDRLSESREDLLALLPSATLRDARAYRPVEKSFRAARTALAREDFACARFLCRFLDAELNYLLARRPDPERQELLRKRIRRYPGALEKRILRACLKQDLVYLVDRALEPGPGRRVPAREKEAKQNLRNAEALLRKWEEPPWKT